MYCPWSACDQFVGQHQSDLCGIGSLDDVQRDGVGVVVAHDLLGQHREQHRPQIERVGDQAEQSVRGGDVGHRLGRVLLVEPADEIALHRRAVADGNRRRLAERETHRLLDTRDHVRGEALDLGVGGGDTVSGAADEERASAEQQVTDHDLK